MGLQGRLVLGFKPRHGSHTQGEPHGFERVGTPWLWRESGPRGFGVLLFATWLRQQERLCWEEKG